MPVHPTHSYTHKDYLSLSLFSFLFHLTHIYTSMPVGNRSYSTTLGPFSFIRPSPLSLTHTHSYILFLSLFSHFFSFMTPYPPPSLSLAHTHTQCHRLWRDLVFLALYLCRPGTGTAITLSMYLEFFPLDFSLCRPGTGTAISLPLPISLSTWNSSL